MQTTSTISKIIRLICFLNKNNSGKSTAVLKHIVLTAIAFPLNLALAYTCFDKGFVNSLSTFLRKFLVSFNRTGSFNRNFTKAGGRVSLTAGQWYDMLFYNADTEYIIFGQNDLNSDYMATTRSTSHNVYTRASEEDADMPSRYYSDYNQPDELFGSFIDDMQISEDPDHYEHIIDSLGNVVSVFNIETTLKPYTFIYLLQVVIVNNNDDKGARVLGGKGLTLTGMAQGAASVLDSMQFNECLGTIAGDDTIFALCRTEALAKELKGSVEKLVK